MQQGLINEGSILVFYGEIMASQLMLDDRLQYSSINQKREHQPLTSILILS